MARVIYARDEPERVDVEGDNLPRLTNWTCLLPALELGQMTTYSTFPLLGLRELAVEGLHVQPQRPLVDVLLLGVRVSKLDAPVVLQQAVVRHPQVLLALGSHRLQTKNDCVCSNFLSDIFLSPFSHLFDLLDVLPEGPVEGLENGGGQVGQVSDAAQCVQQRTTRELLQLKER